VWTLGPHSTVRKPEGSSTGLDAEGKLDRDRAQRSGRKASVALFTRFRQLLAQGWTAAKNNLPTSHPERMPRGDTGGRRVVARVTTALACLLVLFALVAPNELSRFTPWAFVRIPLEGLLGIVLLVVLPSRARQVVAVVIGVGLGLLTIMTMLDLGFFAIVGRPFDPVLDWVLFNDAVAFVMDSAGRAAAGGAVIAAAVLAAAVLIVMTLAVLRVTRLVVGHKPAATSVVAVLATVWIICAVVGAQIVPGVPVAARSAATLVYDHARQVRAGLQDPAAYAKQAAVDAFRHAPPEDLLTALRGKDVIVAFVESYGRSAVADPEFASQVGALLDAGNRRLGAAGYASRSAFLTSPVAGGGSWLAHATFLSGLWIDNQQRYQTLVSSDRLTLTRAFHRANWRTTAIMPGTTQAWPQAAFYGFDQVHDSRTLGYRGPNFSWSAMPDEYTLLAFERAEHARRDRAALMAEIDLTSSHFPWTPIPRLIAWNNVGDGAVYHSEAEGDSPDVVWQDPAQVRSAYERSIEYSLNALISYVQTYGDDRLVLIFLGDHQPAPIVTGAGASRDVPITIVTRDRAVLNRISGWGWQDGLKPGPQAPVWPMDAFRDRFLTAFR
jgi:hypothetical protein